MAGITVARADIEAVTGLTITAEKFAALDRIVRVVIAGEYPYDIDTAAGRAAAALNAVYTSATIRLLSNPTGVSLVSVGSGQVSYGGATEALQLTAHERRTLNSVKPTRRSYFLLRSGVPW